MINKNSFYCSKLDFHQKGIDSNVLMQVFEVLHLKAGLIDKSQLSPNSKSATCSINLN